MHKTSTFKISNSQKKELEPSAACVNFILNYSKAVQVKESKLMETIVIIRN